MNVICSRGNQQFQGLGIRLLTVVPTKLETKSGHSDLFRNNLIDSSLAQYIVYFRGRANQAVLRIHYIPLFTLLHIHILSPNTSHLYITGSRLISSLMFANSYWYNSSSILHPYWQYPGIDDHMTMMLKPLA